MWVLTRKDIVGDNDKKTTLRYYDVTLLLNPLLTKHYL